ncbi:quinone-dependent dihydroorotate dehydrogenase [Sandaracinobacter sp. RS1-74]|uniref:quinone-dependent dihydroorotate dehydrogenase n=1 Tax=Sandaracinobacteroides sayramensis TaxID=2913411 RepID=UPI001EDC86B8|nr:quinone-dependent dihydroorotate dehydrogenase [Sandaracinobacteroides sayramensis]MCG2839820.1 quinone-dependent dihydroorotate dehydrogenase [Sandaracinobacteroides sayramensis]
MFGLLRPALFALQPETAHNLTLSALSRLPPASGPAADPVLETKFAGLAFPTPIGLAAGFDKDARVWRQMLGLGFGFAEVGTLTPRPQAGNPKPRVFRLVEDRAVINRLGFNNGGLEAALPRIRLHPRLGVNVGANKDSADRIADYVAGVRAVRDRAAWITLNISSPNTPGLRGLQGEALPELLAAAAQARGEQGPPLFLKVAPDLDDAQIDAIAEAALASRLAALIVSNTTLARPETLRSPHACESGGLSGEPLKAPALAVLKAFRRRLGARLPLIGAGGIASADDAYARIRAGASAVQLYSAMVYEGPGLAARIATGLAALLRRDGFASVADAVGVDMRA